MGNCIRKESGMQWAGEDWSEDCNLMPVNTQEEENLREHKASFSGKTTEVKIKITKKQLQELLGSTDVQGLSVQQVLAHLINVSGRFESHQRPWRPALQSIPELN